MRGKKLGKNIIQWFENLSFFRKIVAIYVICGILPILGMLVFYFSNTYHMLLKQSYSELDQRMVITESSLTTTLQPYKNIIENIKNDRKTNIQINANYTDLSYSELSYYLNTTVDNWKTIHPDIEAIRFYTNNDTLPDDDYYFYKIQEMDNHIARQLDRVDDSVIFSCRTTKGEKHYVLISKMNYYASSKRKVYVEIELDESVFHNLLYSKDKSEKSCLLDPEGMILYSSEKNQEDQTMTDIVTDWEKIEDNKLQSSQNVDGEKIICLKKDMDMGVTIFILYDQNKIIWEALELPVRFAIVVSIFTLILFSFMYIYSKRLNRRLQNIVDGMHRIGSGDFSHKFLPESQEEFGQIEDAVDHMSVQIDDLIQENYKKQLVIKSTELNLLQEQINPHFLYNALGVISSLSIQERAKKTNQSIRYLADFYRISLNKGRKIIHISEEINLLRNYMKIQILRFSEYVEIEYDVEESIEDLYTIKLLLQPLVENAIHHARDEEMFLTIHVRVYGMDGRVCFDVEDNGMGMEPEVLERLRQELLRQEEGFGLKNVDRRIKLNYGSDYGITIFSTYGKGSRIHIEIPVCLTPEDHILI